MYNLAYPISFHFSSSVTFIVFTYCNVHLMFMILIVHTLGLWVTHTLSFLSSDIMFSVLFLSSIFFHLHILPFFTTTVLTVFIAYAKLLLLYLFWHFHYHSLILTYGPEMYENKIKWSDSHSQEQIFSY